MEKRSDVTILDHYYIPFRVIEMLVRFDVLTLTEGNSVWNKWMHTISIHRKLVR